ncbi:TIGR00282 family metallophosphoesterase [Amorphus sp. 3PC139-8]|uniref:TIGR00282 family metallophosphoesterase n=1 Tax=Amorphus sp. 3PC139-8 TaxID=2735676 RepID=UPI00345DD1D7
MRLLFLGDVVGRAGRTVVTDHLPGIVANSRVDFVVINGENAAGGFGITEAICQELLDAGADVITLGNHAWDQREALVFIERQPRLVRPANFPLGTPGRGADIFTATNGARVLVANLMGRIFMDPLDDPFAAIDRVLDGLTLGRDVDAVVVDVHAEATSEKQGLGYHLDGRASLVVGTHTHVPTADHRILSGGTGYMSDVGMCGDYDSVIGMEKDEPLARFTRKIPQARYAPANGAASLSGVAVEIDDVSGLATKIQPLRLGGELAETWPELLGDAPSDLLAAI